MKWEKTVVGWRSGPHEIRSIWGRRDGRSGAANQRLGWKVVATGQRFRFLREAKDAVEKDGAR